MERVEKRSSTKDRESRKEQRRQEKAVQEAAENNRRAKYYKLTAVGKKQLTAERNNWARVAAAIARVMETA